VPSFVCEGAVHPFGRLDTHTWVMICNVSGLGTLFIVAYGKAVNAVLARIVREIAVVLFDSVSNTIRSEA
jgi:hypothetical protein